MRAGGDWAHTVPSRPVAGCGSSPSSASPAWEQKTPSWVTAAHAGCRRFSSSDTRAVTTRERAVSNDSCDADRCRRRGGDLSAVCADFRAVRNIAGAIQIVMRGELTARLATLASQVESESNPSRREGGRRCWRATDEWSECDCMEKGGGGGPGYSERGGLIGTVSEVRQIDSGILRDSETDSQSERELGREQS